MMIEKGVVVKTENNVATVSLKSTSACESCAACCSVKASGERMVLASNMLDAKDGDEVEIMVKQGTVTGIAFILYIFPLIVMGAGYFFGVWLTGLIKGEIHGMIPYICAGFAFAFALVISYILDRWYQKKGQSFAEIAAICSDKTNNNEQAIRQHGENVEKQI